MTGDRGQETNPAAFEMDHFTVYSREYEALQMEFPGFSEDRLYELLDAHDAFLGVNPHIPRNIWHIPFVAGCRKLHAAAAA